jgi:hypothetical protein
MKRSGNVHAAAMMPRRHGRGSMPRREVVESGPGPSLPTAPLMSADSIPARETADHRGVVLVLLFSLLAFGWLLLVRNVRAGLPGKLAAQSREAVVAEPGVGPVAAPISGARPETAVFRTD